MKKTLIILAVFSIVLFPHFVFAGDALGSGLLNQSVGKVGLESDLETSVSNIITAILAVIGTIFLVLTVVAGIMWMTASGNEEKIAKAQKIIIGAVIGLAVVLSAYTITYFVSAGLSKAGGASGSAPGCCALHDNVPMEGNDWKTMSESVCVEQVGYLSWTPGACED